MADGQPEDLITNLPNPILHLILSLIPTKSVVIASSVSKTWTKISADHLVYAKTFDFTQVVDDFHTPNQFSTSVNKIIGINRSEKIIKFKLVFMPENDEHKSNAIRWINFAVSKDVEEIDLDFCRQIQIHYLSAAVMADKDLAFELPAILFDCSSLITVKLSHCILGNYSTGFSGVQTIYLKQVYVTDMTLESLLSNCRLLEVLVLKECGSLTCIRIVASMHLKRLTVYQCYNASILEVCGRNIRSLFISTGQLDACKLEDMPMLQEVFIGTRGGEFGGVLYILNKVWSELSHIRALTLYLGYLAPSLIRDLKVKLDHLQELTLINNQLYGLFNSDVYCFLKHFTCPSLKKISIELSTDCDTEITWEYRTQKVMPVECVFKSLKTVTLRNFRGNDSDIELAVYFLQRAPLLQSLLLHPPQSWNINESILKDELLRYHHKASPFADIRICQDHGDNSLLSLFKCHHVSDVLM